MTSAEEGQRSDASPAPYLLPTAELGPIFEAVADSIVIYDETGRLVQVNAAASRLLNIQERPEFFALPIDMRAAGIDMWDMEGNPVVAPHRPADRVLRGETLAGASTMDIRARTLDGSTLFLNISGAPIRDAAGKIHGAVLTIRDITERKHLERELAERANQIESIFEAITDGLVYCDTEGHVIHMNAANRRLLGYTDESMKPARRVGDRATTYLPRDIDNTQMPQEVWPINRVLRGETLTGEHAVEMRITTLQGREVIVSVTGAPVRDESGAIVGAVTVTRDVTEQRQLQHEAAQRAAELETVFETMTDGVALRDASGHAIRMNSAYPALMGITDRREVDLAPVRERVTWYGPPAQGGRLLSEEDRPLNRALRGEVMTGANAVEMRVLADNGREISLSASVAPVRDESGHVVGVVSVVRDVTEQRRVERQRLKIMRTVGHDLANPVAALRLYIQTQQRRLARGQQPFVPNEELLESTEYSLKRIERLLSDLKVATSIELGTLRLSTTSFDLTRLCHSEIIAQQTLTGRQVVFEAPADSIIALGDVERVGQVFGNLLSNALKYSPDDTQVTVTLRAEAGSARVDVGDKGQGIPEAEQPHIWEEFYRTKQTQETDASEGLGLGLFISQGIIIAHGGQIGVVSKEGEGSTFWFTLPLAPEEN